MTALKSAKWKMLHADRYKPYDQSLQTALTLPQYTRSQTSLSTTGAGEPTVATGAEAGPTEAGDPSRATGPNPSKTTGTVQPLCVNILQESLTQLQARMQGPRNGVLHIPQIWTSLTHVQTKHGE